MAFAFVVLVVAVTAWVLFLSTRDEEPAGPVVAGPVDGAAAAAACAAEAALVRQLLDGGLQPPQYQHAMAVLAATDAGRKPLNVPPERLN